MWRLKKILIILFDNWMADKRATKRFLYTKLKKTSFLLKIKGETFTQ